MQNNTSNRMSNQNKKYNNLYQDLQSAIEDDKLYWIRNDAKIKAVETTTNYEEFRQKVAAAHLQSMSSSEIKQKKTLPWNKVTSGNKNNE